MRVVPSKRPKDLSSLIVPVTSTLNLLFDILEGSSNNQYKNTERQGINEHLRIG